MRRCEIARQHSLQFGDAGTMVASRKPTREVRTVAAISANPVRLRGAIDSDPASKSSFAVMWSAVARFSERGIARMPAQGGGLDVERGRHR